MTKTNQVLVALSRVLKNNSSLGIAIHQELASVGLDISVELLQVKTMAISNWLQATAGVSGITHEIDSCL